MNIAEIKKDVVGLGIKTPQVIAVASAVERNDWVEVERLAQIGKTAETRNRALEGIVGDIVSLNEHMIVLGLSEDQIVNILGNLAISLRVAVTGENVVTEKNEITDAVVAAVALEPVKGQQFKDWGFSSTDQARVYLDELVKQGVIEDGNWRSGGKGNPLLMSEDAQIYLMELGEYNKSQKRERVNVCEDVRRVKPKKENGSKGKKGKGDVYASEYDPDTGTIALGSVISVR